MKRLDLELFLILFFVSTIYFLMVTFGIYDLTHKNNFVSHKLFLFIFIAFLIYMTLILLIIFRWLQDRFFDPIIQIIHRTFNIHKKNIKLESIKHVELIEFKNFLTFQLDQNNQYIMNQQYDSFISFAHDIKSPLASLGCILFKMTTLKKDEGDILKFSIERINYLTENLLSSLKRKNVNLIKKEFNILNLINNIILEKNTLLKEKSINFKVIQKYDFENFNFMFYEGELARILSNIINNSIESLNKIENFITIILSYESNFIIIEILDNGCGIEQSVLNDLGKKGYSHNKLNGNGYGLYFIKQKLLEWDGSLSFESNLNKGTRVIIKFNLEKKNEYINH